MKNQWCQALTQNYAWHKMTFEYLLAALNFPLY